MNLIFRANGGISSKELVFNVFTKASNGSGYIELDDDAPVQTVINALNNTAFKILTTEVRQAKRKLSAKLLVRKVMMP